MSTDASHATENEVRDLVERLVGQCDPSVPTAVTEALRAFLTAKDDRDSVLMRSHWKAAVAACVDAVNDAVEKRLGWPQQVKTFCRRIMNMLTEIPSENLDDLGTQIETRFDAMSKILVDLRDGPVKLLMEHGYEIANVSQLDSDIQELQQLKKDVLENWPWSNRELPPVNWAMVDASMAALARGEKGEAVEELINRLGGNR